MCAQLMRANINHLLSSNIQGQGKDVFQLRISAKVIGFCVTLHISFT